MPWTPNLRKGVDLPAWDWLSMCPSVSRPGTGNCYDGKRYMYWAMQVASDTSASTTQLWRFDTWTEGWQFMSALSSGFAGIDVEYDPVRNVLYLIFGNASTTVQVFNLNLTPVTIANVVVAAWTLGTLPALPVASSTGSSLVMPDDLAVVGALTPNGATPLDTGTIVAGGSATSLVTAPAEGTFTYGLVGLYARFTTGALAGQRRLITAVPNSRTLTVAAFGAAPAVGDVFVVETPEGTATAGTTTTLAMLGAGWTVNQYANSDVVIVAGTGAGQRRRIASNTADTLTLAAAVTGNARTGPFTTAPDVTSVFRVVPSSDFLYYLQAAGGTGLYRLDVAQTTGAAWSAALAAVPAAPNGGAAVLFSGPLDPFGLMVVRGAATNTLYRYLMGTNAWVTLPSFGGETFNTGSSSAVLTGKRKLCVFIASSQRSVIIDLTTGVQDTGPFHPFAAPAAQDGHRTRYIRTPDGVEWLYHMRAQGTEFWRIPLEWLV